MFNENLTFLRKKLLDAGFSMLDPRCSMLGARFLMHERRKVFFRQEKSQNRQKTTKNDKKIGKSSVIFNDTVRPKLFIKRYLQKQQEKILIFFIKNGLT